MRAAGFCASSLYCLATIAATGHADGDRRRQTIRPDTEGQVRNVFPKVAEGQQGARFTAHWMVSC